MPYICRIIEVMSELRDTFGQWMKGISYEIAFWNNVYRWKHTFQGMMHWSHYGSEIQLEAFDANQFLISKNSPLVLDVGCGMSYATGNFINKEHQLVTLDIRYIDPLAPYFNRILKRHHKDLPAITFGMMEYLSAFYPQNHVDLIIIQNALDHSANPTKGIIEALNCLKVGGILYLNHHPNEAEKEHYKGFHQYNITHKEGQLVIWNKATHWNISQLLEKFAETTVSVCDNGHVVAVIRKTDDVPTEALTDHQDKREMAEQLITMSQYQRQIGYAVRCKLEYWLFNTIQFFAQALPWSLKMSLKKLIKQA